VVLDHLGDEAVQRAAAGGRLLQHRGAAGLALHCPRIASTCPRMRLSRFSSLSFSASDAAISLDLIPDITTSPAPKLSLSRRIWIVVLRAYLVAAVALVVVKVVQLAAGQ
jgi:hypothetical protein